MADMENGAAEPKDAQQGRVQQLEDLPLEQQLKIAQKQVELLTAEMNAVRDSQILQRAASEVLNEAQQQAPAPAQDSPMEVVEAEAIN